MKAKGNYDACAMAGDTCIQAEFMETSITKSSYQLHRLQAIAMEGNVMDWID